MNWKMLFEKSPDGWFTVTVPSLPGCISQGKTRAEAVQNIKEAIELHLNSLAEDGIPIREERKTEMVSVRL
ncbi:MAG: type II toxin-antitoxin system HicB family antitoxin [Candidatus Diapherotrites archaeon]|nr:type II toxin-antitoxin system HicB family antitoxin [Candidatus Diapherotrites archaeon]